MNLAQVHSQNGQEQNGAVIISSPPNYVPKGLAWHMSYNNGYFLGFPLPDGKTWFLSESPQGAILARDWYKCGLRELCANEEG